MAEATTQNGCGRMHCKLSWKKGVIIFMVLLSTANTWYFINAINFINAMMLYEIPFWYAAWPLISTGIMFLCTIVALVLLITLGHIYRLRVGDVWRNVWN